MSEIRKFLLEVVKKPVNITELNSYVHNKGNAKLGDALVNFIYSLAKTIAIGIPTGMKVSDSVLTEAYRNSLWCETNYFSFTGKKGRIADGIEALILYFWIYEELNIENFVKPISDCLEPEKLHHPREEYKNAVLSFKNLLNSLYDIYHNSSRLKY